MHDDLERGLGVWEAMERQKTVDEGGRLSGTYPAGAASDPGPATRGCPAILPGWELPGRPWPAPVPGWHPRVWAGRNAHWYGVCPPLSTYPAVSCSWSMRTRT